MFCSWFFFKTTNKNKGTNSQKDEAPMFCSWFSFNTTNKNKGTNSQRTRHPCFAAGFPLKPPKNKRCQLTKTKKTSHPCFFCSWGLVFVEHPSRTKDARSGLDLGSPTPAPRCSRSPHTPPGEPRTYWRCWLERKSGPTY